MVPEGASCECVGQSFSDCCFDDDGEGAAVDRAHA